MEEYVPLVGLFNLNTNSLAVVCALESNDLQFFMVISAILYNLKEPWL